MLGELENRGLGARSSCLPTIASYLEGSARNAVYQWFNGNVVRHDTALKKLSRQGKHFQSVCQIDVRAPGKWQMELELLRFEKNYTPPVALSQDYDDYDYHLNRSQTSNI